MILSPLRFQKKELWTPYVFQFIPKKTNGKHQPVQMFLIFFPPPSLIFFDEGFPIVRFFSPLELFNNKSNKSRNNYTFAFYEKSVFLKNVKLVSYFLKTVFVLASHTVYVRKWTMLRTSPCFLFRLPQHFFDRFFDPGPRNFLWHILKSSLVSLIIS